MKNITISFSGSVAELQDTLSHFSADFSGRLQVAVTFTYEEQTKPKTQMALEECIKARYLPLQYGDSGQIASGNKIQAIKLLRERTGKGLGEAKEMIEAFHDGGYLWEGRVTKL